MVEPLKQPRVPVARGSPPKKKARRKKTAAARGDDDDVLEKAMRQAEEELLGQKQRMQQLWEENHGKCLEGHQFPEPVTGIDKSSCMCCGSSVIGRLTLVSGRAIGSCMRWRVEAYVLKWPVTGTGDDLSVLVA